MAALSLASYLAPLYHQNRADGQHSHRNHGETTEPVVVQKSNDDSGHGTAGRTQPVFECDFGRLGIQICYDMEFDDGWAELARQGAELIAWPTQSPQTSQPAFRARQHRVHVVSSTWRHNASIFEPTGKIVAQIKPPQSTLVHELDLSYALLPWSAKLRNGEALKKAHFPAITTEILDAPMFYYAEEYHQQYLAKNPLGYCGIGGTGVECPTGLKTEPG